MSLPRPVATPTGWRLAELAVRTGATLDGDGAAIVTHVDSLESAGPGAIAFVTKAKYRAQLVNARATAVILAREMAASTSLPKLVSPNPYATYAKVAALLHPPPPVIPGVHPSAIVGEGAQIAPSASVGALAVIQRGTRVGERTRIGPGCAIGADAAIGDDSLLHANVTIYDGCIVGPRAIIHSGAVIGADGFGVAEEEGRWLKIPQIGRVVIGADVEIGANTTIDRGAIGDTLIEDGVKLDNQIQIGHNCRVGAHTAIAGCVGIAGSVRIGRHCKIGGAAKIAGHLEIPDGTVISAAAVVLATIDKPGVYAGAFPAADHMTWKRMAVGLRHLAGYASRLRALERRLAITGPAHEPAPDEPRRSDE